ncbi:MAG: helix-turn-helix transcriptional regulator [Planctomycetales bacterium]|nr:helix-turn-helix transcriptional regulator [Planctomycetales bacterium]MBN8625556.1 helix-turn-helix transcriptional regulator [Planctomycetota bacterium]
MKMADGEDAVQSTSVGGMAANLGVLPPVAAESQRVFGRLIEFARRARGLSVEQLATHADVDLAEIVDIEREDHFIPTPRTVYQLAQVLNLPSGRLTEVAGLTTPRSDVSAAALKFAARSEPTATLSAAEREAFEEFVKVLVEATDGG